jgi:hypothetical protein
MLAAQELGCAEVPTLCLDQLLPAQARASRTADNKLTENAELGRLFGYEHARATRTAWEAYCDRTGVCRDYTHLAVAFSRCMNISGAILHRLSGRYWRAGLGRADGFRSLVRSLCRQSVVHL